jgi:hypothetical protein
MDSTSTKPKKQLEQISSVVFSQRAPHQSFLKESSYTVKSFVNETLERLCCERF